MYMLWSWLGQIVCVGGTTNLITIVRVRHANNGKVGQHVRYLYYFVLFCVQIYPLLSVTYPYLEILDS